MQESEEKGKGFYLVNKLEDSSEPDDRHLSYTPEDQAHLGLLFLVLSVIYMNNGQAKQDALFLFLEKLGLYDRENDKKEVPLFGNVKTLIEKEWGQKQHYIKVDKDDSAEPDTPANLYSWGERAELELKKSDVLKYVAKIYDKKVRDFSEQFNKIRAVEGEDVFEDFDECN